ncbi:MAG: NADH-quinone oxidoreductase subunit C [Nitrosopumilales archaeon]|nr:MAG: NADH-quinone oxidoreductase subunit C [Nitrosopumilales archaeon]
MSTKTRDTYSGLYAIARKNKKVENKMTDVNNDRKETTSNLNIVEPDLNIEHSLYSELSSKFKDKVQLVYTKPNRIKVYVEPEHIIEVAFFLKSQLGLDHAESVCGTDYPNENVIEVIYHLNSYSREELASIIFALSTKTDRNSSYLPSLLPVFKSVEYHERETYEMLGVYFQGHPRNERFLLPEDWADIPPLKKDFRIKGR